MAELEIPSDIEALCLARGDEVNPHRPLFTGDVIDGVTVEVLDEVAQPVVIVSHPCSMRAGAELAPLLHVAPVVTYHAPSTAVWQKHFKVMPIGAVANMQHAVVKLDRMTLVSAGAIDPGRRLYYSTRHGINLLRQRMVHHLTRVAIPTQTFDEEAGGAHEEADLMEDWIDSAIDLGADAAEVGTAFHDWIMTVEGGRTRQAKLLDSQAVPGVRRAMRAEIRGRYSP
ncbi:hypothetical protein [Iamia sp.]|uniref:hypothetical protein n=1 Tax=Iamia sp. TaxID=2722710 RepID=UPI002CF44CA2|nr:hypothetical protein [Iamia sp.]HXH56798.1 hypothetical protein [Iamia sp.]